MTGVGTQLGLLFWKNWLLQKRKVVVTIFEISLPLLFAAFLLLMRSFVSYEEYLEPTYFDPFLVTRFSRTLIPPTVLDLEDPPPFYWQLGYSPDNSLTNAIAEKMVENLQPMFAPIQVRSATGFPTENEMVDFFQKQNFSSSDYLGGIAFHNMDDAGMDLPTNITYSIRLNSSPRNSPGSFAAQIEWPTDYLFPFYQFPVPREKNSTEGGFPGYYREGFLAIQHAVDKAFMQFKGANTRNISTVLRRYPYPPYYDDRYVSILQFNFPDVIMFGVILIALNITRSVTHEKEKRLKESMKMMGLSNWIHWTAWFLKSLIYCTIIMILMSVFFLVPLKSVGAAVVNNTNPVILFIFLMMYSIATIMYSFMISSFFSKANSATVAAGGLFFISYTPYYFSLLWYSSVSLAGKISIGLICHNTAMGYGGLLIALYEGTGSGIQWDNINEPVSIDDDLTFTTILILLGACAVFYGLVTWYVEAVFPGEYGIPQPWYFFVTRDYWLGPKVHVRVGSSDEFIMNNPQPKERSNFFEAEPKDLNPGVSIRYLKKIFDKGKIAVNGISMNMFEGQITVLLGHNGAGKTTTLSMLTGLFPPTSGTATVNNHDIVTDIRGVRESLGLCPQHNVLFSQLTVEEHLYFFARMKGLSKQQANKEVEHYVEATGLQDKRKQYSKSLSGGMKRKLSVGIALIADSKVVMLDEPTSGMDPDARRFTWDLLQRHRANRTILLTTHFMDEADLLGDRIAIMSHGELQCFGSSLFLKKHYGVGYHMVMVKEIDCDISKVSGVIHSHVPGAVMESNAGAELSFILPEDSVKNFEALFTQLEKNKKDLKISGYGASLTTMEEVFLKVGEESNTALNGVNGYTNETYVVDETSHLSSGDASAGYEATTRLDEVSHNSSTLPPTAEKPEPQKPQTQRGDVHTAKKENYNTGVKLYFQQFYAMIVKYALYNIRNYLLVFAQMALPVIIAAIGILLLVLYPEESQMDPLVLTTEPYEESMVQYSEGISNFSTDITQELGNLYASQFPSSTEVFNIEITDDRWGMSEYLLSLAEKDIAYFNRRNLVSATFNQVDRFIQAVGYFNNQPYHCPPLALSAVNNAYMKYLVGEEYQITTINHPLPATLEQQLMEGSAELGYGSLMAFNLIFAFCFLSSSFAVFLIQEGSSKAKHLQFISGIQLSNFWISRLIWDLFVYSIPCLVIVILFIVSGLEAYSTEGRAGVAFLIFVLQGWAVIPLTYLLSFMFKEPSTGYARIIILNMFLGLLMYFVVEILKVDDFGLLDVANILDNFFMLLPPYAMAVAIDDLYIMYQTRFVCTSLPPISQIYCDAEGVQYDTDYLRWSDGGIGRPITYLSVTGLFYFVLVFVVDSRSGSRLASFLTKMICRKKKNLVFSEMLKDTGAELDDDVIRERDYILNTNDAQLSAQNALVIKDVEKVFSLKGGKGLVAVDKISVGVPVGECFGLLGVNGAGKTTTFKMLTGDEAMTSGHAYIDGFNVKTQLKQAQQRMGYCPQFDALIDKMTGRETLTMFARLRGVPERDIPKEVNQLMKAFKFEEHADKIAGAYSGGNKRKLSTAIALVGEPPVVFLDEPTTGMDPVARRSLWDSLSNVRDSGKCIILTSHSMEECEALCTRLAIMVNGQFKCLGSTQHLKTRFGEGYTILAKVSPEAPLDPLKEFIHEAFTGAQLKDEHQNMVHYHISTEGLTWGEVFGKMERNKSRLSVEDYSVSQTSLEQVFLNFARRQREDPNAA